MGKDALERKAPKKKMTKKAYAGENYDATVAEDADGNNVQGGGGRQRPKAKFVPSPGPKGLNDEDSNIKIDSRDF